MYRTWGHAGEWGLVPLQPGVYPVAWPASAGSNARTARPSREGSSQALCLDQGQHPRATVSFRAGHPHGAALQMLPHPFPGVYSHKSPSTKLDRASGFALQLALAEWEVIRAVKVTANLVLSNLGADIQTLLQGGKPCVWVVNILVSSCPNSPSGELTLAGINGINQPVLVPLITVHAVPLFIPLCPQHTQGRGLHPLGSRALPPQG